MSEIKYAGINSAVYFGPSQASVFAVCSVAANVKIARAQAVQEEITYCLVEPVAGPKTGKISGKLFLTKAAQQVTNVTVTNQGSGYTAVPTVSFTGGGGTGAAAIVVADLTLGKVVSVFMTNQGSGYTSAPTIAFAGGGGGTGAAATAVVGDSNTDWMEPLFNGTLSVNQAIYFDIRPDGTATGRPTLQGYFVPTKFDISFPSDKGAVFVEFEGVTNGWPLFTSQA